MTTKKLVDKMRLFRKLRTAFSSPAVNYIPAVFRCHTRAKPMRPFALKQCWCFKMLFHNL